jgi:glycosyltransferase involved in cell wall biosynthesis
LTKIQKYVFTQKSSLNDLMKQHPLVSICIPTYNGEAFILEAIASALTQTYDFIEIIVSDDNSEDNTGQILQSLQDQISINFSIYHHPTLGIAENCNFCIQQARGKYIKFLFQDDILLPNCVKEMVELAEISEEIGLVFSVRDLFFATGDDTQADLIAVYQDFQNIHQAWSNLKSVQWGQDLLKDPQLLCHPINKIGEPSTVLIRQEVFKRVGGFDPQLNQLVDLEMWLRIMKYYQIGFINKSLSKFRLNCQQKTYKNIRENADIDLKFYLKLYQDDYYDFLEDAIRSQSFFIYNNLVNNWDDERGFASGFDS